MTHKMPNAQINEEISQKNFRYLGPSMCFSKWINWIISEVQRQNFFLKVFSPLDKVLAVLGSGIGTCSVFLHSFPFKDNVPCFMVCSPKDRFHNLTSFSDKGVRLNQAIAQFGCVCSAPPYLLTIEILMKIGRFPCSAISFRQST